MAQGQEQITISNMLLLCHKVKKNTYTFVKIKTSESEPISDSSDK